jgi:hypothetical protein
MKAIIKMNNTNSKIDIVKMLRSASSVYNEYGQIVFQLSLREAVDLADSLIKCNEALFDFDYDIRQTEAMDEAGISIVPYCKFAVVEAKKAAIRTLKALIGVAVDNNDFKTAIEAIKAVEKIWED